MVTGWIVMKIIPSNMETAEKQICSQRASLKMIRIVKIWAFLLMLAIQRSSNNKLPWKQSQGSPRPYRTLIQLRQGTRFLWKQGRYIEREVRIGFFYGSIRDIARCEIVIMWHM